MALWLNRAGKHGEHEQRFLEDKRIYLTWTGLPNELGSLESPKQIRNLLKRLYPGAPRGRITNWQAQIWAFSHRMAKGDWVVLPSKLKRAIHVGKMTGDYTFHPEGGDRFFHYRGVEWIAPNTPRDDWDQDLLHSLQASMTICQIVRNDAERRVRNMVEN